jgi:hypothetical protein
MENATGHIKRFDVSPVAIATGNMYNTKFLYITIA